MQIEKPQKTNKQQLTTNFQPLRNTVNRHTMKIQIYCMNEAGQITGGLITSNPDTAAAYMQRKQQKGLITIKTNIQ